MARRFSAESVEAALAAVEALNLAGLRTRWRAVTGGEPPVAFGRDLLLRALAHRLERTAKGDLDRATAKRLDALLEAENPGELVALYEPVGVRPGTVLVRSWKGEVHTVTAVAEGFSWRGETLPSLSAIALRITGTSWNGPRFFGLRSRAAGVGS